jgi:hypothetical protein
MAVRMVHTIVCRTCGTVRTGVTTRRKFCRPYCKRLAQVAREKQARKARLLRDPQVKLEERLRRKGWLPEIDAP